MHAEYSQKMLPLHLNKKLYIQLNDLIPGQPRRVVIADCICSHLASHMVQETVKY